MKRMFAVLFAVVTMLNVMCCFSACGSESESVDDKVKTTTTASSVVTTTVASTTVTSPAAAVTTTTVASTQTTAAPIDLPDLGSVMVFGSYEQDNNTANGQEPIEWIVLDAKDGRALLISQYALDVRAYHTENEGMTWENCELREWLNGEFMDTAFTKEEQDDIPVVAVSAGYNPKTSILPGNATEDRVFILSGTEIERYLDSDAERQCLATEYAVANGAYSLGTDHCFWWLRTPGKKQEYAACVTYDGDVGYGGLSVVSTRISVRPAMWIDL